MVCDMLTKAAHKPHRLGKNMDKFGAYIAVLYMLGAGLAAASIRWRTFSDPSWITPSLLRRSLAYALCNGVSCVLLVLLIRGSAALYTYWTGQTFNYPHDPAINLALLLLAPVPLATWFTTMLLGWLHSSATSAARYDTVRHRKNGLTPPLRLNPGTALPAQFRSHDFSSVDLSDDEMVRELAHTHWRAINDAAASHGDATPALTARAQLLEAHLGSLPAQQAERIRGIYETASMPHAAELTRITAEHRKQRKQRLQRRAFTLRNIRRNTWLLIAVIGVASILRLIWLFS